MNKATIVLITLAALGLGALIGKTLVDNDAAETVAGSAVPATAPAGAAGSDSGGAPPFRYLSPGNVTVEKDQFGSALPSAVGENYIGRDKPWKSETVTIELPADGAIEYKLVMEQGDTIVYNWKVAGGQAYYDFHAHDDAFGEEFFSRYAEGESDADSGGIVAAYDGQHGWFWLNLEGEPVTITLEVAGFFDEIVRLDLEGY